MGNPTRDLGDRDGGCAGTDDGHGRYDESPSQRDSFSATHRTARR
jgi:hypothetical protein